MTAIDLGEPYIDASRITMSLPNGRPIVVTLRTAVNDRPDDRTGAVGQCRATGWTRNSDGPWLTRLGLRTSSRPGSTSARPR